MINPKDETHIDLRTSCTRDEAVAVILGLLDAPVHARPMNDDATPEELEIINSHMYSLQDDLEERRDSLESDLTEAKLNNLLDGALIEKREALQKFDALIDNARICSRHIDDEIAKGELSALRVDKRATGNSTETRFTINSVDRWVKANPEISILDQSSKHVTENSSTQPVSQPQNEPGAKNQPAQQDLGQEQDCGPKGGLSRVSADNLHTSFAFLVEALAKTANELKHDDGRPKVSTIAARLERLAKEANKQEALPGQSVEAIKRRIEEAMRIKKSKLPKV